IIFMFLGPFIAVTMISLLGRAMMVDRYVLLSLVAFLALAASGAEAFAAWPARGLVLFLIILLSVRALRHSSGFWVDWREATAIACANSPRNAEIGVVPAYAVNVVRYHLPPERRSLATGLDSACGNSQLLIVNPGHLIPPDYMSQLLTCYPQLVGRATRVEVRSR
ncbi:MAG TPA: hypothetical protein VJ728_12530, partial [Candidatus Binataceae bacterium]|nr:hypothetical protein [Candidatus Binataceae bacterium]